MSDQSTPDVTPDGISTPPEVVVTAPAPDPTPAPAPVEVPVVVPVIIDDVISQYAELSHQLAAALARLTDAQAEVLNLSETLAALRLQIENSLHDEVARRVASL